MSRQEHVGIFRPDLIHAHGVADIEEPLSILPEIRARAYDVALIATEKPYGYLLAHEAGIPERIGFWNGLAKPFKGLWTRALCTSLRLRGFSMRPQNEVEMLFALGRGLSGQTAPTRDADRLRELFLREARPRRPVLSVQVSPKWRAYGSFPAFIAFLTQLAEGGEIRLIGAANEELFLAETEERSGIPIERHHFIASWIESIATSQALLTPDTGAAHVAGMTGTPVIDVFPDGASRRFQRRWRPWAAPGTLLTARMLFRQDPRTFYQTVMG